MHRTELVVRVGEADLGAAAAHAAGAVAGTVGLGRDRVRVRGGVERLVVREVHEVDEVAASQRGQHASRLAARAPGHSQAHVSVRVDHRVLVAGHALGEAGRGQELDGVTSALAREVAPDPRVRAAAVPLLVHRRGLARARRGQIGGAERVVVVVGPERVQVPLQSGLCGPVGLLVVLVLTRKRDVGVHGGEAGGEQQPAHGEHAHERDGREALLAAELQKRQMHRGPSVGVGRIGKADVDIALEHRRVLAARSNAVREGDERDLHHHRADRVVRDQGSGELLEVPGNTAVAKCVEAENRARDARVDDRLDIREQQSGARGGGWVDEVRIDAGPDVDVLDKALRRRVVADRALLDVRRAVAEVGVEGHLVVSRHRDRLGLVAETDLGAKVADHQLHRLATTLDGVLAVGDLLRQRGRMVEQHERGEQQQHPDGHRSEQLDQREPGFVPAEPACEPGHVVEQAPVEPDDGSVMVTGW